MSTEIVKAGEAVQLPAPIEEKEGGLLAQWQATASAMASSLATDDDAGRAKMIQGLSGSDRQLKNCVGQELRVTDYLVHEVELADLESGELKSALRTVLYLDDGTTVSTCSAPFVKSWGYVLSLYGRGPYRPCILVRIGQKATTGTRAYLKIDSVARPVAAESNSNGRKAK